MRRNPTLPTIRQSISAVNVSKVKQGVQSFRKIEDKIHSHDQQIVKNEKIISNLANEFRMLKEQLEFEQQYNEKYKNTMSKYEEETSKHLKVIRDQKQLIARLEHLNKEKDKNIELITKEKALLKERVDQLAEMVDEQSKEAKKKDGAIKLLEGQLEKAKKEVKQKEAELKQKQAQLREAFVSDRQIRQSKVKKLEKDIETLNIYLENSKEQINGKDREIQRLSMELFQIEQKLKAGDRHEIKAKSLVKEVQLAQRECEQLRRKLKECEDQNKLLEVTMKTQESKTSTSTNQKFKQVLQEKKELTDRLDKAAKEIEEGKKRLDSQRKQRQKIEKRQQESKERLTKLQAFYDKLFKSKGEINQQLSKLKSNILCDFCSKTMKNPVTNIPCGHSYCQQCKAGYLKECKKCSGVKREAVYRNQLLDQIIQASNLVQRIVILMNS